MSRKDIPPHLLQYFKPRRVYKPKDDMMMPHRLFDALMTDGWYGRMDNVWAKKNPMPESVTDRPTKAHEYIFMLTKAERYFYDADAVREDSSPASVGNRFVFRGGGSYTNGNSFNNIAHRDNVIPGNDGNPAGRNLRSVWTVATQPYAAAHFATYPPDLIRPCIRAGCPERVCPVCGRGWVRVVEVSKYTPEIVAVGDRNVDDSRGDKTRKLSGKDYNEQVKRQTLGFRPDCDHYDDHYRRDYPQARSARKRYQRAVTGDWWQRVRQQPGRDHWPTEAGVTLDPFMGSGTTALVARQERRRYVGIELNREYIALAQQRFMTGTERLNAKDSKPLDTLPLFQETA